MLTCNPLEKWRQLVTELHDLEPMTTYLGDNVTIHRIEDYCTKLAVKVGIKAGTLATNSA